MSFWRVMNATNTELKSSAAQQALDVAAVKALHVDLYDQVQEAKEHLKSDPAARQAILPAIDTFIGILGELSRQIQRTSDYAQYDWLDAAATTWQEVFSWIMAEPRNLRSEIRVPRRPTRLISSRARADLPYSIIESDIRACAFYLGEQRKMRSILARIQELQELERGRNRIHNLIPSTPEEQNEDW